MTKYISSYRKVSTYISEHIRAPGIRDKDINKKMFIAQTSIKLGVSDMTVAHILESFIVAGYISQIGENKLLSNYALTDDEITGAIEEKKKEEVNSSSSSSSIVDSPLDKPVDSLNEVDKIINAENIPESDKKDKKSKKKDVA